VERRRHARSLSLAEREEISRGLSARCSIRQIARRLGRAASSISREVRRHGRWKYRAVEADRRAWRLAERPKVCKLGQQTKLRSVVADKLGEEWSPKQIAGWLPKAFAHDHSMRVSHETIYRSLFIQSRGVLKKELQKHLRTQRRLRQSRRAREVEARGQIVDAISISERPAEAMDRAVPGHWEGDLLEGSKGTQIATLVERHSRFVMLVRIPNKGSTTVVKALSKTIQRLPQQLRRSLTCRCTSAIRVVPGNEAPTRTPMDCFGSTSPKEAIYQCTRRHTSTRSLESSISAPEKPWASTPQQISLR
jgi:IS30 family transposase